MKTIFVVINIVKIGRWLGLAIGTIIIGYAIIRYFKKKEDVKITPIHQPETVSNNLTESNSGKPSINESNAGKGKVRSILNGHEFDKY